MTHSETQEQVYRRVMNTINNRVKNESENSNKSQVDHRIQFTVHNNVWVPVFTSMNLRTGWQIWRQLL